MAAPDSVLRVALCQINVTVGDIDGNERRIAEALEDARGAGAQLILFPELAITGYPPEDLLHKSHFLDDARAAVERLAERVPAGLVVVLGCPDRDADVYNGAAVLADRRIAAVYHKMLLPNYGVFDEQRYFQAGTNAGLIELGRHRIGITVCEDIWQPGPPISALARGGATLIVNISASPYHALKGLERERLVAQRAREHVAAIAYCALVGGQDELVFDGHSLVVEHTGTVLARGAQFEQDLVVCDVDLAAPGSERLRNSAFRPGARNRAARAKVLARFERPPAPAAPLPRTPLRSLLEPREAEIYAALRLGLSDYVSKNGFTRVVLGLSGGVDSALVATIAADALGPERVSAVVMPSAFSSDETQEGRSRARADARRDADRAADRRDHAQLRDRPG